MSTHSYSHHFSHQKTRSPFIASLLQPFSWLARGWQDLTANPTTSLAHGLAVSALAFVVLFISGSHIYILAAAISGFMLIGPVMSAGLCEISRLHEKGKTANFDQSLNCIDRNEKALVQFATLLLSVSVFWFLLSALLLSVFIGRVAPSLEQSLWGDFFTFVTPNQILLYFIVGGLLAAFVFVISVVSIPAIIDKNMSEIEAVQVSVKAFAAHLPAMLVWAIVMFALTALGFASALIGMVLIYPLLAHATWHAYRDLVPH